MEDKEVGGVVRERDAEYKKCQRQRTHSIGLPAPVSDTGWGGVLGYEEGMAAKRTAAQEEEG